MIAIIGAGLAGLTAARELQKQGCSQWVLYEAAPCIGGRITTEMVDGFLLDRGFQVLNPAYSILDEYMDTNELDLGYFDAGARLFVQGGKSKVFCDPLTHLIKGIKSFFPPPFAISDLLKASLLRAQCMRATEPGTSSRTEPSTMEYLRSFGFSDEMMSEFLLPFFSGVFLDSALSVPASYFQYIFKLFGKSRVGLPRRGMQDLPRLLASGLSQSQIELGHSVEKIEKNAHLVFESGGHKKFDAIIVATDVASTQRLCPWLAIDTSMRTVTTFYFASQLAPWNENLLGLIHYQFESANHISIQSLAQSSYAPEGQHLIAVNVLNMGDEMADFALMAEDLRRGLKVENKIPTDDWRFLKAFQIPKALPKSFYFGQRDFDSDKVLVAGDFTENPSIGGAMLAGKKAARRALKKLKL